MRLCVFPKKTSEDLNKLLAKRKNKQFAKSFKATAYSERVIFVPHCMRNIEKCKAKEVGSYYTCVECGGCKVGPISKKSKELGYKALYILKGGKAVEKIIQEVKPKAVLGVACFFEGVQAIELTEKHKMTVQFVPLTKDGCVSTDVDVEDVFSVMKK